MAVGVVVIVVVVVAVVVVVVDVGGDLMATGYEAEAQLAVLETRRSEREFGIFLARVCACSVERGARGMG